MSAWHFGFAVYAVSIVLVTGYATRLLWRERRARRAGRVRKRFDSAA